MMEQGKSIRSPPPENAGTADTMYNELTTTSIAHPLCYWSGGGIETRKKRGMEGKWFKIQFLFCHYPTLFQFMTN